MNSVSFFIVCWDRENEKSMFFTQLLSYGPTKISKSRQNLFWKVVKIPNTVYGGIPCLRLLEIINLSK